MYSVWDIYLKFMQVIFGSSMPDFIIAFILILFLILIFSVLFKIFKMLAGGLL